MPGFFQEVEETGGGGVGVVPLYASRTKRKLWEMVKSLGSTHFKILYEMYALRLLANCEQCGISLHGAMHHCYAIS